MIKIKEFANLCQCSTQTLRYYDRIKLLSPAYVDDENGYRYYKHQLYDYIKLRIFSWPISVLPRSKTY